MQFCTSLLGTVFITTNTRTSVVSAYRPVHVFKCGLQRVKDLITFLFQALINKLLDFVGLILPHLQTHFHGSCCFILCKSRCDFFLKLSVRDNN